MFLSYLCRIIFFVSAELIVNRVLIDVIDLSELCKYCCTDFACKETCKHWRIDCCLVFYWNNPVFAASALVFQLPAFNRLVSVLAELSLANLDHLFDMNLLELVSEKHSESSFTGFISFFCRIKDNVASEIARNVVPEQFLKSGARVQNEPQIWSCFRNVEEVF